MGEVCELCGEDCGQDAHFPIHCADCCPTCQTPVEEPHVHWWRPWTLGIYILALYVVCLAMMAVGLVTIIGWVV